MKEPKIGVVEVFRSPQGEGFWAGRDAVFVRLAGCNLSCVFADGSVCDTPYQKASLKVGISELFSAHILPLFPKYKLDTSRYDRTMLIITGGEPTLAPAFDEIVKRAVRDYALYVAIETNGTHWRDALRIADHVTISPKVSVKQGSRFPLHNWNPGSPDLNPRLVDLLKQGRLLGGELRYVIGPDSPPPQFYHDRFPHFLSPAVLADGTGQEWQTGFPGFVPGAVDRCLELIREDPRWRLSIQTHKILGVR